MAGLTRDTLSGLADKDIIENRIERIVQDKTAFFKKPQEEITDLIVNHGFLKHFIADGSMSLDIAEYKIEE